MPLPADCHQCAESLESLTDLREHARWSTAHQAWLCKRHGNHLDWGGTVPVLDEDQTAERDGLLPAEWAKRCANCTRFDTAEKWCTLRGRSASPHAVCKEWTHSEIARAGLLATCSECNIGIYSRDEARAHRLRCGASLKGTVESLAELLGCDPQDIREEVTRAASETLCRCGRASYHSSGVDYCTRCDALVGNCMCAHTNREATIDAMAELLAVATDTTPEDARRRLETMLTGEEPRIDWDEWYSRVEPDPGPDGEMVEKWAELLGLPRTATREELAASFRKHDQRMSDPGPGSETVTEPATREEFSLALPPGRFFFGERYPGFESVHRERAQTLSTILRRWARPALWRRLRANPRAAWRLARYRWATR